MKKLLTTAIILSLATPALADPIDNLSDADQMLFMGVSYLTSDKIDDVCNLPEPKTADLVNYDVIRWNMLQDAGATLVEAIETTKAAEVATDVWLETDSQACTIATVVLTGLNS